MELILISETKLKIMLDENDMRQYNIGGETDCAEPTTRRAIRNLLECARDRIGFNTEGEEIFVQLYTSKKGGCELFVTKCQIKDTLKADVYDEKRHTEKYSPEHRLKKQSRLSESQQNENSVSALTTNENALQGMINISYRKMAFSFQKIKDLISVCKILKELQLPIDSRAFSDDQGIFYLLLINTGLSAYSRLDKLTFINEYGKKEHPEYLISYISEHGKTICSENAVEILCDF